MEDLMAEGMIMGDVIRNDLVQYDELSVMHFRALDALNVREFALPKPGVYALAHTTAHDELHTEAPYHFATADDIHAALALHLSETDPGLKRHAERGDRWFRVVYAEADKLDAALADLKHKYAQ
jgi:hypothetical protein